MVNSRASSALTESAELTAAGTTDDAEAQISKDQWIGNVPVTIGETGKLYKIEALEYKTGATSVTGDTILGAFIVNSTTPTNTDVTCVALTYKNDNAATSTTYKVTTDQYSLIFRGGQIICAMLNMDTSTTYTRTSTISSQNLSFAETYSLLPVKGRTISWSTQTTEPYIKIYYRQYS